jgi:metal-responsive CopG/Arc/MetJ family transcriptional regulator
MGTARLNITLPEEMIEELDQVIGPRHKSRFIASTIRNRLDELRAASLREEMTEGYHARHRESSDLAKEFETADLEGWDDY